ncbi:MAG TPA: hypothetical protein VGG64_17350 [Pirellulales bacterium]
MRANGKHTSQTDSAPAARITAEQQRRLSEFKVMCSAVREYRESRRAAPLANPGAK